MDHLHFSARSQRRVRRRKLVIATWLVGVVATFLGVPGSNAALSVFRTVSPSHALAGSFGAPHSARTGGQSVGEQRLASAGNAVFDVPAAPKRQPAPVPDRHNASHPAASHTAKPKAKGQTKAKATPQPSPSPTPAAVPVAPTGSITSVIYSAAAEMGLSGSYLLGVADCESSLNPQAHSGAGYYGLFQFDRQTWMSYGYGSIYDPVAQARTAARLLAAGQASRWPNCT
jgi:soluble lytic murein transglycosylase-like protein